MSVVASGPFSSMVQSNGVQASQGGNDRLAGVGSRSEVVDSPNWVDKNNNGKIDVEVDFDGGPGNFFSQMNFKQYQGLTPLQKRELLDRMNEISGDTNLVFHQKGEMENPDGKMKFGNYAPQVGKRNAVEVHIPANPDEPVEAYIRGDRDNLNPTANNKGGSALARALLRSLGLPDASVSANAIDSRGYSLLSHQSETTTGHDFKSNYVTRPQMKDLEQLTKKFGVNDEYESKTYYLSVLGREGQPVTQSIASENSHDTLDAKSDAHNQKIDLTPGAFSSVGGFTKNVAIIPGTIVEDVETGEGINLVIANSAVNKITLGSGTNTVKYKNISDSPRDRPDQIVGFKTGQDKLDLADFTDRTYYGNNGSTMGNRLDIEQKPDGSTWVKWWMNTDAEGPTDKEPDFLLRADGIRMSDIVIIKVV